MKYKDYSKIWNQAVNISPTGSIDEVLPIFLIKINKKLISELKSIKEPSNRFNLGLNSQEQLAYFNGYEDTINESVLLIEEINKKIKDGKL